MYADCHIHMVLDGVYYKDAIAAHGDGPREDLIRRRLARYRELGLVYLRDGGDRWGGRTPGPGAGGGVRHHIPDAGLSHLQAGPLRRLHRPGL